MKKIIFARFLFPFVILSSLLSAQPVIAHGQEPRLEISMDRLNPGSIFELRGVDFEFEQEVVLKLVGPQVEFPLGTVIADTEGVFLLNITLPVDLVAGTYVIRATTDDHVIESPQITIWGSADLGGGEDGPVDEEDGPLVPLPTYDPNIPTPIMGSSSTDENEIVQNSTFLYLWIASGMGVILLLVVLLRVRR
jgi:hypothetical protein